MDLDGLAELLGHSGAPQPLPTQAAAPVLARTHSLPLSHTHARGSGARPAPTVSVLNPLAPAPLGISPSLSTPLSTASLDASSLLADSGGVDSFSGYSNLFKREGKLRRLPKDKLEPLQPLRRPKNVQPSQAPAAFLAAASLVSSRSITPDIASAQTHTHIQSQIHDAHSRTRAERQGSTGSAFSTSQGVSPEALLGDGQKTAAAVPADAAAELLTETQPELPEAVQPSVHTHTHADTRADASERTDAGAVAAVPGKRRRGTAEQPSSSNPAQKPKASVAAALSRGESGVSRRSTASLDATQPEVPLPMAAPTPVHVDNLVAPRTRRKAAQKDAGPVPASSAANRTAPEPVPPVLGPAESAGPSPLAETQPLDDIAFPTARADDDAPMTLGELDNVSPAGHNGSANSADNNASAKESLAEPSTTALAAARPSGSRAEGDATAASEAEKTPRRRKRARKQPRADGLESADALASADQRPEAADAASPVRTMALGQPTAPQVDQGGDVLGEAESRLHSTLTASAHATHAKLDKEQRVQLAGMLDELREAGRLRPMSIIDTLLRVLEEVVVDERGLRKVKKATKHTRRKSEVFISSGAAASVAATAALLDSAVAASAHDGEAGAKSTKRQREAQEDDRHPRRAHRVAAPAAIPSSTSIDESRNLRRRSRGGRHRGAEEAVVAAGEPTPPIAVTLTAAQPPVKISLPTRASSAAGAPGTNHTEYESSSHSKSGRAQPAARERARAATKAAAPPEDLAGSRAVPAAHAPAVKPPRQASASQALDASAAARKASLGSAQVEAVVTAAPSSNFDLEDVVALFAGRAP